MITGQVRFYHDQIPDDTQRAFYDAAEQALLAGAANFRFAQGRALTNEQCQRLVLYMYGDHPECIDFNPFTNRIERNMFGGALTYNLFYHSPKDRAAARRAELENAIARTIRECFPRGWKDLSEIRREKEIFSWLVRNVTYDYDAFNNPLGPSQTDAWSAYGALVQKKAVCQGIACAFKLLCDQVELASIVVIGDANGRHAWNIVRIERRFFHIDCTWLLRSGLNYDEPYARYRYFNLPDWALKEARTPEMEYLPKCTSLRFNPFFMRGMCANDLRELERTLDRQLAEKNTRLAALCVKFKPEMDDLSRIFNALSRKYGKQMQYYRDVLGYFVGARVTG